MSIPIRVITQLLNLRLLALLYPSRVEVSAGSPELEVTPTVSTIRAPRVKFNDMPRHSPINLDTVCVRRLPRIFELRHKQHNPSLNHIGFVRAAQTSEEEGFSKDYLSCKEDMYHSQRANFMQAMEKEINNQTSRHHWAIRPRDELHSFKILRSIWVFLIKRNPSIGEIIKHKARCCAGGRGQEKGANHSNTYTPVANGTPLKHA